MKLSLLIEGISEDAALRVFSRLVTTTNGIAELLDRVGAQQDEDLTNEIEAAAQSLQAASERISTMGVSSELWKSLKTSVVSGRDIGNSWMEFQSLITRRLVPEIVLSLSQLTSGNIENIDAKLAVAKERTQNLQEVITGIAPTTGGLPTVDTDQLPEPMADQGATPEEAETDAQQAGSQTGT